MNRLLFTLFALADGVTVQDLASFDETGAVEFAPRELTSEEKLRAKIAAQKEILLSKAEKHSAKQDKLNDKMQGHKDQIAQAHGDFVETKEDLAEDLEEAEEEMKKEFKELDDTFKAIRLDVREQREENRAARDARRDAAEERLEARKALLEDKIKNLEDNDNLEEEEKERRTVCFTEEVTRLTMRLDIWQLRDDLLEEFDEARDAEWQLFKEKVREIKQKGGNNEREKIEKQREKTLQINWRGRRSMRLQLFKAEEALLKWRLDTVEANECGRPNKTVNKALRNIRKALGKKLVQIHELKGDKQRPDPTKKTAPLAVLLEKERAKMLKGKDKAEDKFDKVEDKVKVKTQNAKAKFVQKKTDLKAKMGEVREDKQEKKSDFKEDKDEIRTKIQELKQQLKDLNDDE